MPPVTPAADEGFTFISHAAPDKRGPVKLLVRALAREGLPMFIDRPGQHDASCMGLSQDFIDSHRIRGIPLAVDWNLGLLQGLRDCRAVLLCLSASAVAARTVLHQEAVVAVAAGKLLTCVIDGSDPGTLGGDWGMATVTMKQTLPIDMPRLEQALDWLDGDPARTTAGLPPALRPVWDSIHLLAERCRSLQPLALDAGTVAGLHELQALVEAAAPPAGLLRRLFLRSLPDAHRAPTGSGSLVQWLAALADSRAARPSAASPLVEFAERLARALDQDALRQWVDRHADVLVRGDLRDRLDQEAQQPIEACLFIDLDTAARSLTWWIHSEDPALCSREAHRPLPQPLLPGLGPLLGEVMAEADMLLHGRARQRVALLLPHELLAEGLDALPVPVPDLDGLGLDTQALCHHQPVTLHWRNRALAAESPAINAWRAALASLAGRCGDHAAAEVVWSPTDEAAARRQALQLLEPAGQGLCLGLEAHAALPACIRQCLREGLPFLLWFRQPAPPGDARQHRVSALFDSHTPAEAPRRASELRRLSLAGDPFEHLSILWDTSDFLGQ